MKHLFWGWVVIIEQLCTWARTWLGKTGEQVPVWLASTCCEVCSLWWSAHKFIYKSIQNCRLYTRFPCKYVKKLIAALGSLQIVNSCKWTLLEHYQDSAFSGHFLSSTQDTYCWDSTCFKQYLHFWHTFVQLCPKALYLCDYYCLRVQQIKLESSLLLYSGTRQPKFSRGCMCHAVARQYHKWCTFHG